jgi:catechol 2,3-dioxygenase-like lactoylglutathione lyase family enzyme
MTVTHIQVISIPVSDQDRARDFYVDTLGFTLLADQQFSPEMRWVMVAPPGGGTTLTLVTWFESMPAGSLKGTVLETDDLDGDAVALAAKGVLVSDVENAPWGRFVTFDDPDGNGIVLQASVANAPQADVSDWQNRA